jgi:hypothetical protein
MDARSLGLAVFAAGIAVALLGLLIATGALSWFGRLPGDINIDRGNVRVFVPITSMILASIVLSLLLLLARRWL